MQRNKIIVKENCVVFEVAVLIRKEGKYFVAYCPYLELSGYSDSVAGAKKSFEENVGIFLNETIRKGTFEQYLISLGWKKSNTPSNSFDIKIPSTINTNLLSIEHVIIPVY